MPLDSPATEGDLVCAALAAYGWPAFSRPFDGVDPGIVVPYDAPTSEQDVAEEQRHLLVFAGERADWAVGERQVPWSVHQYGESGEHLCEVYTGPAASLGAAVDAAECAYAVITWIRSRLAL